VSIINIKDKKAFNNDYQLYNQAEIDIFANNPWLSISASQRSFWFLYKLHPELQGSYNHGFCIRILRGLDETRLNAALNVLISRHPMLRVRFRELDGEPAQGVDPRAAAAVECVDAGDLDEAALKQRIAVDNGKPFDLAAAPLLRATVYHLRDGQHILLISFDHIITDGWSFWQLLEELGVILRGDAASLPPPVSETSENSYFAYVQEQRQQMDSRRGQKQRAYWLEMLSENHPYLDLPLDRVRPRAGPESHDAVQIVLSSELTSRLHALAVRNGATLYVTLLTAYFVLLRRLTGQDAIAVGSPMPARGGGGSGRWRNTTGTFFNPVVLRAAFEPGLSAADLMRAMRSVAFRALSNQDYPFSELAAQLNPPRDGARQPFFQTMFAFQNARGAADALALVLNADERRTIRWGGCEAAPFWRPVRGVAGLDLVLELAEFDDSVVCAFEYSTALFERSTIERWLNSWRRLLEAMADDETQEVDRLPLLDEAERCQALAGWNATDADYPRDACVHELFEAWAAKTPGAVAVEQGDASLTYGELNARANKLARQLRAWGAGPDQRVAICMQRGLPMAAALLAVLKAGAAYVPLDPAHPTERLLFMLEDSAPVALLTDASTRASLDSRRPGLPVLDVEADASLWEDESGANLDRASVGLAPEHLVYVIYTSGSTGVPKGVMAEHLSLNNLIHWHAAAFELKEGERATSAAGVGFDAAAWEFWPPLCMGARMAFPPPDAARDPERLLDWWTRQQAHVSFLPTPLGELALGQGSCNPYLQTLLIGGDRLRQRPAQSLPFSLVNNYGPTETTVVATSGRIAPSDAVLHIGRPIANARIYILNPCGEPAPIGVAGELYIGGAGVARGYLNRPDLTAERFLPDPFAGKPEARMYRTGDLGRWLPDGTIEFLGRNDFQVKIRGFRIELGEIEARLTEHPLTREAVVAVREDVPGDKRLAAYYTASKDIATEALRAHMAAVLPDYMVPASYMRLDALPLTPNGKLDRKALPAPEGDAYAARGYEAPVGKMEETLALIWAGLLGLERVGRRDNFFELGGHSLLAAQVISRLRQTLNIEAQLAELFARPTLSGFAAGLADAAPSVLPRVVPTGRDRPLALSFAQQRLWFLAQFEGASSAYHIPCALRLEGRLNREALVRALDRIVARHEALRTSFALSDGQPVQRIASEDVGLFLGDHDLRGLENAEAEMKRLAAEEATAPFDLENGPLIRGQLLRLGEEEHVLLVTMHHIVSDGWSVWVLIRELKALYGAFSLGAPDPLPPLSVQYADYAAWQRSWLESGVAQQQAQYWKAALSGAPALLELPADRPRPAQQDYAGAMAKVALDSDLTRALKGLSQRHGVTLYMTLLAAWAALLARLSGQDEVVIGSPAANRGSAEIEGLVGFFVNTLAMRIDASGSPSAAELLARVKTQSLAAQSCQDIPLEQVVEIVQPPRSLAHSPLFQVMFAWQNAPQGALELSGLTLSPVESGHATARVDLSLSLEEAGDEIVGWLEYATALFDRATVERYLGYWRRLLEGMAADDGRAIDSLPVLDEGERQRVLVEWNATRVDYPLHVCAHELFEAQAARTPDAVAVTQGEARLSYGELNIQANRLAHHLRGLGVGPDCRVAVCMQRGPNLLAALLAILKAGGAYVPLDPAYPARRLSFMLDDCAPAALLTDASAKVDLPDAGGSFPVIDLTADAVQWEDQPGVNPHRANVGLTPGCLAYVVYTSGSTGAPKGVMVKHSGLSNLIHWHCSAFELKSGDRCSCVAGIGFDAAGWEIWPPLCAGASLALPPAAAARDPEMLMSWWDGQAIDVGFLPTPMAEFAMARGMANSSLRALLVGGDRLRQVPVRLPPFSLVNNYGPTETTVVATSGRMDASDAVPHIGRPIANTRIYILDAHGQPTPSGVAGELYISGAGVARGYLNRPELTAERFLPDPFAEEPGARMYRTGDLGRWRPDGAIEFLGRNDSQVKIRGFRIEQSEIELRLMEHPLVREAVVAVREDGAGDKRLVAYYLADSPVETDALRFHVASALPDYMIPAAYVRLDSLPLTPNGKLDRKALPAPEGDAFAARGYQAPFGETEETLARIWGELLGLDRVGRHDNFFELGGHSLLAVTLIERLRQLGMRTDVRALFSTPTLAGLAAALGSGDSVAIPDAPLIQLEQHEIERIAAAVPGGAANLQDFYSLAPLQEGILFHHLMASEGDAYLLPALLAFDSRARLDSFLSALQAVIDRHDILRTGVMWEGLPQPVQVVQRRVLLPVEEVPIEGKEGDAAERLLTLFDPRRFRIDVREAPLMRAFFARDDANGRWLLLLLNHHLAMDHTTLEILIGEVQAHLLGEADRLPPPLPFRNFVAQARLGVSEAEHEAFFCRILSDVDEPTAPFGLSDVQGDGSEIEEARVELEPALCRRLRERSRALGVSAASLFHLAWAQVLARASGRDDVVFGTVLFGRMQGGEGADRALGMFINTLPIRIAVGDEGVEAAVRRTHGLLAGLLRHEHASLGLAQRCSGVPAPAPLFSALLNYRHSAMAKPGQETLGLEGVSVLYVEERTNYPLALSVDDLGESFLLTAQAPDHVGARRVCGFMNAALANLAEALLTAPATPARLVEALPEAERHQVVVEWNATDAAYPHDACIHELFEEQALKIPKAAAVVFENRRLTYAELNAKANRLARHLRKLGVRPDSRVAICMERSLHMVVGLLAILKAGGAYVPIDPSYPPERIARMLEDSAPTALLTNAESKDALNGLGAGLTVVDLSADAAQWADQPAGDLDRAATGLTPEHLAYVIYTSGSTGVPKGAMNEHRGVVNRLLWMQSACQLGAYDAVLQKTPFSFDVSVWEFFWPLITGAWLVLARPGGHKDPAYLAEVIRREAITTLHFVPSMLQMFLEHDDAPKCGGATRVICSGEALPASLARRFHDRLPGVALYNLYGPTEAAVDVTAWRCERDASSVSVPIGRPIANTRIYILDAHGRPAPVGVAGELHIGGVQVGRGYLNRPKLTAERFIPDPFSGEPGARNSRARMYRTGDLARWRPDGVIEFLGRNDFQVKLRGFRIELGEIEARLREYPLTRDAVVIAREDSPGDKRLVAYYAAETEIPVEELRAHLEASLPDYMVPAACVRLDALPLSPNGKLDRKALPAPEGGAYAARGYETPIGETETNLARIWSEVLSVEQVGRSDNFFDLGGHSLLALMLIQKIRTEMGVEISLFEVFSAPRLASLAELILDARFSQFDPDDLEQLTAALVGSW
jgi:amino acid adenylation domain-containing protein